MTEDAMDNARLIGGPGSTVVLSEDSVVHSLEQESGAADLLIV